MRLKRTQQFVPYPEWICGHAPRGNLGAHLPEQHSGGHQGSARCDVIPKGKRWLKNKAENEGCAGKGCAGAAYQLALHLNNLLSLGQLAHKGELVAQPWRQATQVCCMHCACCSLQACTRSSAQLAIQSCWSGARASQRTLLAPKTLSCQSTPLSRPAATCCPAKIQHVDCGSHRNEPEQFIFGADPCSYIW